MPNRILRGGMLTSKTIARLSAEEHRLFTSLLLVVDDFGRFECEPAVIRGQCFPYNDFTLAQIETWLGGLAAHGIIRRYSVGTGNYFAMVVWKERPRAAESRFPAPPESRSAATAAHGPADSGTRASSPAPVDARPQKPESADTRAQMHADANTCEQPPANAALVVVGVGVVVEKVQGDADAPPCVRDDGGPAVATQPPLALTAPPEKPPFDAEKAALWAAIRADEAAWTERYRELRGDPRATMDRGTKTVFRKARERRGFPALLAALEALARDATGAKLSMKAALAEGWLQTAANAKAGPKAVRAVPIVEPPPPPPRTEAADAARRAARPAFLGGPVE